MVLKFDGIFHDVVLHLVVEVADACWVECELNVQSHVMIHNVMLV